MARIFVSYRRSDSDVIAGRIRDRLARSYGDDSVFMDIDNIRSASTFAPTSARHYCGPMC
jgi:hypothetical protein